nr:hypothetical protein [Gemmatales bacterium]
MPSTFLTTFRVDATVPIGHSLCGGWIRPASKIGTPLFCDGLILQGPQAPIVLVAIDWTGIQNASHVEFTKAIAQAAHTTPERVALHCVHQHNAPFIDATAQQLASKYRELPAIYDTGWLAEVQEKV